MKRRTLFLMRHGKSSWEEAGLRDFDRPLLAKGIRRTARMAEYMLANGMIPGLIVSSPAVRALETARIAAQKLGCALQTDDSLYPASVSAILDVVSALDDSLDSVMITAHNPGLSDFVSHYIDKHSGWLTTSGLAALTFEAAHWYELPMAAPLNTFVLHYRNIKLL